METSTSTSKRIDGREDEAWRDRHRLGTVSIDEGLDVGLRRGSRERRQGLEDTELDLDFDNRSTEGLDLKEGRRRRGLKDNRGRLGLDRGSEHWSWKAVIDG